MRELLKLRRICLNVASAPIPQIKVVAFSKNGCMHFICNKCTN